jgi:erythronate-4-phosphate dehydrogenase
MNLLADHSLPNLEVAFPSPFHLTRYENEKEIPHLLHDQDALLCRSTLKVNAALLGSHALRYVATASSGTDHIDAPFLKSRGIQMIDAKGSNAQAVADYVLACLAYLQKIKEFKGQRAGIIGLGAVGSEVAERLHALHFEVLYYDPLLQKTPSRWTQASLPEVMGCDLICVHANLHEEPPHPSRNLLSTAELALLKPNSALINAARGGIICEEALLALAVPIWYCTDVFVHEPSINARVLDFATLCTPHIAGHSLEAKVAAIHQISQQLHRCLGLPVPSFQQPPLLPIPAMTNSLSWADRILSFYHPLFETQVLKDAKDIKKTFIELRKAHCIRHDFSRYSVSQE